MVFFQQVPSNDLQTYVDDWQTANKKVSTIPASQSAFQTRSDLERARDSLQLLLERIQDDVQQRKQSAQLFRSSDVLLKDGTEKYKYLFLYNAGLVASAVIAIVIFYFTYRVAGGPTPAASSLLSTVSTAVSSLSTPASASAALRST